MNQKEEKNETIEKLINNLQKKFGDETFFKFKNWNEKEEVIDTGSLMLNNIIGKNGNGYPLGKIIEIFGPESAGKTTLALAAIIDAQKKKRVLFIDVERGLNISYVKEIGIDVDKLIICWPKTAEEALEICIHFIKTNLINLIIIDSIAALIPESEQENEAIKKNIGEQASLISKYLRKMIPLLASSKTTLLLINQIREKIGIIYGSPEITPGGRAIKFYSSLRIEIRKN